jgi:hypothetical protein
MTTTTAIQYLHYLAMQHSHESEILEAINLAIKVLEAK